MGGRGSVGEGREEETSFSVEKCSGGAGEAGGDRRRPHILLNNFLEAREEKP